jgi:hypothetical protein
MPHFEPRRIEHRPCWVRRSGAMQTFREAALRPSSCERYPYLPARMWTNAKALADLVASYGARPAKTEGGRWRILSDRDFSFRRGQGFS